MSVHPASSATQAAVRRFTLTDEERRILSKDRYEAADRQALAELHQPFAEAFHRYNAQGRPRTQYMNDLYRAFRSCAQMMLDLDCTYWAFDWERLLAWKRETFAREAGRTKVWRYVLEDRWSLATSTLFFLGALPYNEAIHSTYHRVLAEKWLGKERAREIAAWFIKAALSIGYQDQRTLHKNGSGVLLSVLVYAKKSEVADLTKVDLEGWQAQTRRSQRVARASVTCIQKVLAAMGHLGGEGPRLTALQWPEKCYWGRTPPAVIATFERFLADIKTIREPATVNTYRVCLRRFGDWLGEYDPALQSVAELRRLHIEAYKRAVREMRCGDYTNVGCEFRVLNLGEPLSRHHQLRALSCVRCFCEHLDALDYPERPQRKLWVRGDTPRVDQELPRMIPDEDWQRLNHAAQQLTPEQAREHKLTPFERVRAIFAVLFESGLRAGELCRLDTGCLLAASDPLTGAQTPWLRVPVGKLHNDRMIPVRAQLVAAVDAWMRARGQQPAALDKRTRKMRDLLFTWRGQPLSPHMLNRYIRRLCALAGTKEGYSSHRFRHTLAVLWRRRGMRLETISRMLGHKDLKMTMRYAAVMPPLLRQEFETAFAAMDEEHRATAQVRVLLSPEAHLAAQVQWRESLFVDLGIGWCGLTAYHPCETRLACHSCPNLIPDKESLPLLERQRAHLIELRGLGSNALPATRQQELDRELATAVAGIERSIATINGAANAAPERSGEQ